MIEVEFYPYGLGDEANGLCLLINLGGYQLLFDCGLKNPAPLIQDLKGWRKPTDRNSPLDLPLNLDLMYCSHAHRDHFQGFNALCQAFPDCALVTSEVTAKLLAPLLNPEVDRPISNLVPLKWYQVYKINSELTLKLFPAGHLPGASACLLTYTPTHSPLGDRNTLVSNTTPETSRPPSYTVLFMGDYYLSNTRLTEAFRLQKYRGLSPDILILEGSLGTARVPSRREQEGQVVQRIRAALEAGRSVLMPVPPLGLAQELILILKSHPSLVGQDLTIWIDPEIAAHCETYLNLLEHFPTGIQNFAQHQPLFIDPRIKPRVRKLEPNTLSQSINLPCIVMVSQTYPLRTITEGIDTPWLTLTPDGLAALPRESLNDAERLDEAETFSLFQHSDGAGTTQLIHTLRPQHVAFVHGPPHYLSDLTGLEELINRYHLHRPMLGKTLKIPIGSDRIPMTELPEPRTIEGELWTSSTHVTLEFPDTIMSDQRWHDLAETGLLSASWQGEHLVIRGLSHRELIQRHAAQLNLAQSCCNNCQAYQGRKCWNPASPLYERIVAPDGLCPQYRSRSADRSQSEDSG